MKIDKRKFFDNYRKHFGNIQKQSTVDSLDCLIDEFNKQEIKIKALEKFAYMLATVRHECGPEMSPRTENLRYSAQRLRVVWPKIFNSPAIAKKYSYNPELLGNKVYGGKYGNGILEGYKYRGRGFVQITFYDNYKKFSDMLGFKLEENPNRALEKDVAAIILFKGMTEGMFTGRKLSGFINGKKKDYYNARSVVNGDKARVGHKIEKDAIIFENILTNSKK